MTTALLLVALAIALFVGGAAIYVLGTYALAHRHAPRGLGGALRDAGRELFWTVAIQPLLPLFYLYGRRMGTRIGGPEVEGRRPVVLVHGYGQNRVDFLRIARTLRRRGFARLFGFNYPWVLSVEDNATRLGRFVAEVCAEEKVEQIDIVCHSMGGLVAMKYLLGEEGSRRVARCVSIATPFRGVSWKGPMFGRSSNDLRAGYAFKEGPAPTTTRLLSIYSQHDNVVHPATTSSLIERGGRDLDAGTMGHLAILFDPAVANAVADFLEEPDPPEHAETPVCEVKAAAEVVPAEAAETAATS